MRVAESEIEGAAVRAQEALTSSPIHALQSIRVERCDDALVLSGKVSSFYHKQLAQEAVLALADEVRLVNSVDVDNTLAARPR